MAVSFFPSSRHFSFFFFSSAALHARRKGPRAHVTEAHPRFPDLFPASVGVSG